MTVPTLRVTELNQAPENPAGDYVLYWMIANRRLEWNYALDQAIEHAKRLQKPLLIFEPLRVRYRWASDRLHRFVIQGMHDHAQQLKTSPIGYYPYVEPQPGAGTPLFTMLAKQACIVVTDDYPCFFLPHMIDAVKPSLNVAFQMVDSNGIVPLRQADRTFTVAHSYRRWMQKNVLDLLLDAPQAQPLARLKLPKFEGLPDKIKKRWPAANLESLLKPDGLKSLPIDHQVRPSQRYQGGSHEAQQLWHKFLHQRLAQYDQNRNEPDEDGSSGLSPHLHFGQISAHQVVHELLSNEGWTPDRASKPNGKNHDFWNLSPSAEAFMDQMLTWREMGFNMTHREPDRYDRYDSLPDWAQKSLKQHTRDPRPRVYELEQFERAETGDELWNAAQRELVQTGKMHNYLRMLWGKLFLQWTATPQDALQYMIELNNKYALDGRDPNSYSGIFWTLGRYDRAWGPTRPIFGNVRYMTSDSTRRKLKLKQYLKTYGRNDPALFS